LQVKYIIVAIGVGVEIRRVKGANLPLTLAALI
jgi:hypothetical protein